MTTTTQKAKTRDCFCIEKRSDEQKSKSVSFGGETPNGGSGDNGGAGNV